MQSVRNLVNEENRTLGIPPLNMGIGINAGEVIVGNIGSQFRAKYGVVGAPVNLTQRIQSAAEGGEVVVPESVYNRVREDFHLRRSFKSQLKGIQGEVTLYAVEPLAETSVSLHRSA